MQYGWDEPYNADRRTEGDTPKPAMKRTLVTIRCVPRYGYDFTEVRTVDLDLPELFDEQILHESLDEWFRLRGIVEAVYAIDVDDDGYFAIVNDESYHEEWGAPLL